MVSNPRLIPFSIASSTGELADANQILIDSTSLTGLINNSQQVQTALERIDATGIGAPIFLFTGNYSAASANISEWFNGQANRHLQGASGQVNGLRTFDLPGTTALNSVFDALVTAGLPELYRLTISYLGGVSGTSVNTNRLTVRPRSSPSPQIDGRASVVLAHGDSVTLEISRTSGTLSSYVVTQEGRLQSTAGTGDVLNDIELQTATWNAADGAALPGTGEVQKGWAFRVINAPVDGSGRFGEVLYTDDWVVWSEETFTQWSDTANWFVIAAGDVRRLTLNGQQFLQHVGTQSVLVRGADYADQAGEIRIQLYETAAGYTPGDLNTNGQIDSYTNTSDLLGYRIAVRFSGTQATLATTLPTLYVYAQDARGNFTQIANLSTDFTFQGDFTNESDYLANADYNYRAGDVLRIYVTSMSDFNTISDYDAVGNIADGAITENKLSTSVQDKLNATSPANQLPPALQALNSQARVFQLTHGEYRSNNSHVYVNNSIAFLKNAPTTFPNTAGGLTNEITGSATSVGDPSPLTAVQDVSRATGSILTGPGLTGSQVPITFIDDNNWRLIIGGWMYYPSLPTSYEPILQVRERAPLTTVYRDVFGMSASGMIFRQRATTGSTLNVGIRHELISTDGLLEPRLTSSQLGRDFRVYNSGTYGIQATGFNGGALQGGELQDYTITAVNQDQAETTLNFNLGVGTQTLRVSYNAQRGRFSGREHELSISADSLIAGLDSIQIDVLSASTTVAATSGNTYNNLTLSDGHAAAGRLMRYIVSFRSINGLEGGNLEAVVAFFGYDLSGNPTYFEENTIDLQYPALDLQWATTRYGAGANTQGIHQNVQAIVLNPDTPLVEYPRHATLNGWLSSHDNKANDWAWDNIQAPNADIEAVYFPEFVNFPNFVLESPDRSVWRLSIDDSGVASWTKLP